MSSDPHEQALSRAFDCAISDHFGRPIEMIDAEKVRADPARPRGGPS